jgi:nucleotide-binding universal stress UspA family protein
MTQTVVVAVDGSDLSEAALPWAALLARTRGVTVTLARVLAPRPSSTIPWAETVVEQTPPEAREGGSYLARLQQDPVLDGLVVNTALGYGVVAEEIVTLAAELDAFAIVMSTHGRGGMNRLVHGSFADAVSHASRVPVLLIPPALQYAPAPLRLGTILVPLDGTPLAETALAPATTLTLNSGRLVLVRVVTSSVSEKTSQTGGGVDAEVPVEHDSAVYLDQVVGRLRESGLEVDRLLVTNFPASEGIQQAARAVSADLLVLASHAYTGFERLRRGSVSDQVIRQGGLPVLVVNPQSRRWQPRSSSESTEA